MSNIKKYTLNILSTLIYFSYFIGFYLNENSIGSGGYNSDLIWIWENFEIFKKNNLIDAIKNEEFFGNRTPLLYLINIYFNPFIENIDLYRTSIFVFSLLGPFIFFLCLKERFFNTNRSTLFLISSLLLLSPFYRTTAFWGMEINYGIICTLASIYFLNKISFPNTNNRESKINIFFLILFSSLTVYFDQKLLVIPIISFLTIITQNISFKIKIFSIFYYIILSLPFFYLIYLWEGIVPKATQLANPNTITNINKLGQIHFYNLGYASTIIGFYLFPLIFLKEKFNKGIKNFFSYKTNYYFILIPFIYLCLLELNYNYKSYVVDDYWIGFGLVHKLAKIIFVNLTYQKIFTYINIVFSWWVISIVVENKIKNILIIFYFLLISLFLWPLMQEYFDPIIIIAMLLFKSQIVFKFTNTLFIIFYFIIFLVCSNIYYLNVL